MHRLEIGRLTIEKGHSSSQRRVLARDETCGATMELETHPIRLTLHEMLDPQGILAERSEESGLKQAELTRAC